LFTINLPAGSADLKNSTVPSVQASAVIIISSSDGFNRRSISQVLRSSAKRFLVVIIAETVISNEKLPARQLAHLLPGSFIFQLNSHDTHGQFARATQSMLGQLRNF
jgi:hypothetical protein